MACPPAGGSGTGILPVDTWENMGGTPMPPFPTFLQSLFAHALSPNTAIRSRFRYPGSSPLPIRGRSAATRWGQRRRARAVGGRPTESVSVGKTLRKNGAGVSYCGVSRGGPVGRFLFPRAEWKNVPSSSSGPSLFPVRWSPFRVRAPMLPASAARFPAARPGGPSLDRGLFRPQPGAPAAPKRRPARAEAGFASAERDHDQVGPSGTDDRRLVACVFPQGPDRILRRLASFRAVGA